jgi:hypothetical protein
VTMPRTLSAVLPVKVSGRHYGENLARLDLLFSSLLHFGEPGLLDELLVVVPAGEAELIGRHLDHWPELPLRVVVEDEHFPAFRRYTRPWQVRPWQRQQIIKLNARAFTAADFVLTLDPDVMAVRPVRREDLVGGGRALVQPEAREVHRRWWLDSADLLDVEPGLDRPGMNVTPAVLSTAVLAEVHDRLESVAGRPWMDVLLTSYCDWTEYTLYLLAAEHAGLLEGEHVFSGDPAAPAQLHVHPELSIWDSKCATPANVERLFAQEAGLFAVVQSNTGVAAAEVAAAAARHFPVRSVSTTPPPPTRGRSRAEERMRTGSRLAATRVYRLRRRLRGRKQRQTASTVRALGAERVH